MLLLLHSSGSIEASFPFSVFSLVNAIEFVAGTYFAWHFKRNPVTLTHGLNALEVDTRVIKFNIYSTGCGACDEYLVAGLYLASLYMEFAHTKVREVLYGLTDVYLALRSL